MQNPGHRDNTALFLGLALFFFLLFTYAPGIFAFNVPQVYFSDYRLDRVLIEPGSKTSGTVTILNGDGNPVPDLHLEYALMFSENGRNKVIDSRIGQAFSLEPSKRQTFSFNYWLPYKLPDARLFLRTEIRNSLGTMLAWADKPIASLPADVFFILDYLAQETPEGSGIIEAGGSPKVIFSLRGPEELGKYDLVSKVVRFTTFRSSQKIAETEVVLTPELVRIGKIAAELPPIAEAGFYRTEAIVFNKGSGDQFSNKLPFEWIVKRQSGNARILLATVDRTSYEAGAMATVRVLLSSYNWDGVERSFPTVVARIKNKAGALAGEKSQVLKFSDSEALLKVPITLDVDDPQISVQVNIDGAVVDIYEFKTQAGRENALAEERKMPLPIQSLPSVWSYFFARFSLSIAIFSSIVLGICVIYYFKVLRPILRKIKMEKQKKNVIAKTRRRKRVADSDSLGELLDEFNRIDRQNKRFKLPR